MVERWWDELPRKFSTLETDAFVVMPNHVHGLLVLHEAPPAPTGGHAPGGHAGPPLHRVVPWLKSMTTNDYLRGVRVQGWTPCPGRLWQRNYYEHIVRSEAELEAIQAYIEGNPANWADDRENPANIRAPGPVAHPLPWADT